MKKLLIIGSNSVHTRNYIALIETYFDEIVLLTNEVNEDIKVKQEIANFRFTFLNLFKTTLRIKSICNSFKPTHIHVHQANSYAFYTALALGKKENLILTAWGSDILIQSKKSLIWKQIVRFAVNRFSFFTADSNELADELAKLIQGQNKILVANFGIETTELKMEKEPIFYSNRLHKPLYRVNKIIEGFNRFIATNKEQPWRLVIGAAGEETQNLKDLVENLGVGDRVEFIGWVAPEINRHWYAKSSYWVSVPESDATSMSLLEAMDCGCIPILSDLPSNKEWVRHGENGIIAADLNGNYFAEVLKINVEHCRVMNKEIIDSRGTKEANRVKFFSLYDEIKI